MRISQPTVRRLSVYLRQLEQLSEEGYETVSSSLLAEMSAVKATQLRKDLSYFGSFGVRGIGYSVRELSNRIAKILGLDESWNAVLIGAGSLGTALSAYREFHRHNIRFVGVLDNDPAKVGKRISGIEVKPLGQLETIRKSENARIAVIAVPAAAAQAVADFIVDAGYRGIVNFAPIRLKIPEEIAYYAVDLAMAFESVTFQLTGNVLSEEG